MVIVKIIYKTLGEPTADLARAMSKVRMLAFSFDECRDRHNEIVTGLPKLLGGYHLWQSQDDNCTAPIDLTDKKVVQIRRCEWEIFHIQLM